MSLTAAMEPGDDATAVQPNTRRPSGQLEVKKEGRKPLFSSATSQDTGAKEGDQPRPNPRRLRPGGAAGDASWWRTKSDTQPERRDSNSSAASPGGTRLPRPKIGSATTQRQAVSLAQAFKLAENEEDSDRSQPVDASPSPAPRSLNRSRIAASKVADTGRELAKVTGNGGNWRDRPRNEANKPRTSAEVPNGQSSKDDMFGPASLPALVPGIEDVPMPSIEDQSPEKSYAWKIDDDFTAGDLQVSDSPRIKVAARPFANRLPFNEDSDIDINSPARVNRPGSQNTRLDEIRLREVQASGEVQTPKSSPRPGNTKIDEIRASEERAEKEIPIPDRRLSGRQNKKIDEIQQLEQNPLSQRALAQARLSDIRERNSMPRSLSVNDSRPHTSHDPASQSTPETKLPVRSKSAFEVAGERIPGTPVTIFKGRRDSKDASDKKELPSSTRRNGSISSLGGPRRDQDRDVLRRLSRAASSSPASVTEARPPPKNEKDTSSRPDSRARLAGRRVGNGRGNGNSDSKERRTVGFAGLRRVQSTESTKSKRSSMASDADPTDRYEAEMRLFAPTDNHSERGSVRAPSPAPESDEEEELVEATPKPKKQDPLAMPTPKVTGAYVETPATVRVERPESEEEKEAQGKEDDLKELPTAKAKAKSVDIAPARPAMRSSFSWRSRDQDTASDPGTGDVEKEDPIAASAPARKPRARSLPRRRPPLKNSAKPPSVKDDLRELQRANNIEDSTLDDFEEILSGRKVSPPIEALMKRLPEPELDEDLTSDYDTDFKVKEESLDADIKSSDLQKAKEEVASYERMGHSLSSASRGIRAAKKGIERLEGQVSSTEKPTPETMAATETKHDSTHGRSQKRDTAYEESHKVLAQPDSSAVAYLSIPVPRLFHRAPHFRLTLLGLIVSLLSLWGAAESAMCAAYCRPDTCSAPPCVWSFDDPSFGTALPIKVDQWTTGGYGREVFSTLVEKAEDWFADMLDAAYGREIHDADVAAMTFQQKRQHRRRLGKRGLLRPKAESPEQRAKWDVWHQTRLAKERAKEAREMGYHVSDDADGTLGDDERIW